MTRFPTDRLRVLTVLMVLSILPVAPHCAAAMVDPRLEVLNLDEAAALLRVKPEHIRKLAESQDIPGRKIGTAWRFSRVALLEWLANGQPVRAPHTTSVIAGNPDRTEPLAGELLEIRARGMTTKSLTPIAQATAMTSPPSSDAPLPTIGERTTTPTAEEIALRDQSALLKRGAVTADFSLSYSRGEQTPLPGIRVEQRGIGTAAALRYGLQDDLQIRARVPGIWRRTTTYADATLSGTSSHQVSHNNYVGDASLSLLGVAVREASGRPNIIWSIDSVLPTGPGDRGLGGGLVLSKSYDPAVIFAGLNYLRGFSLDPENSRRSLTKNHFGLSLGYSYALNDSLALNSIFAGSYSDSRSADGISIPPSRENYQLQLGMTWMLARGLYMEPAVTMRLGGASPDVSFSLNLPYSF